LIVTAARPAPGEDGRGDDDLAKAIYMHVKETGAEPETARQAVLRALGRDPDP